MIVLTLPVRDLGVSRAFYTGLGLRVDERLSDERTLCVVASPAICVMLLEQAAFARLTPLPVADAHACTQVLHCLTAASRAEVDRVVAGALAAGGSPFRGVQDDGCVYARAVADPDGHVWELLHTDLGAP